MEAKVEVQIALAFSGVLSQDQLRAVGETVLSHQGRSGQATLVITDDEGIRGLNRDFLGHDWPTDVLAFPAAEEGGSFVDAPESEEYLGDVIVSYPRAVAQAADIGHTVERELYLLIVHGLLHLLGYDHAEEAKKAAMWDQQEAILQELTS
jgi:probable rRNA maturation factor